MGKPVGEWENLSENWESNQARKIQCTEFFWFFNSFSFLFFSIVSGMISELFFYIIFLYVGLVVEICIYVGFSETQILDF